MSVNQPQHRTLIALKALHFHSRGTATTYSGGGKQSAFN